MKDIQILDLIYSDINKFCIKENIDPLKVDLIQSNGVPSDCKCNISEEKKEKLTKFLMKYKDRYEIIKLLIAYRFESTSNMEIKIGKKQLGKRYKNYLKNEAELMGYLGAKNVITLI